MRQVILIFWSALTWLFDILTSIDEIESYFEDKSKVFRDYLSDNIIWGIVINHLPKLKSEVQNLL